MFMARDASITTTDLTTLAMSTKRSHALFR